VVDGASFSSLPAKHLTFSIMANADRIARAVAAEMTSPARSPDPQSA